MIKRGFHIIFFICLSTLGWSQQDPLFNQYLFNPFYLNPAYSGNHDQISAVLFHRSQWVGFSGAPHTQTFSIHAPLRNRKVGLGFQVVNDVIGSRVTTGVLGSYSYKLHLDENKLSFGIRAGMFHYSVNKDNFNYKEEDDVYLQNYYENRWSPSFDFGLYYTARRYFIGITTTHLNEEELFNNREYSYLKRHYVATAGYAFKLNNDIMIKPTALIRYTKNAPIDADLNINMTYKDNMTIGLGYRTNKSVVVLFNYKITSKLWAGYSFDMIFNDLNYQYKGSSHEIYIGYDLNIWKQKTLTPRFL